MKKSTIKAAALALVLGTGSIIAANLSVPAAQANDPVIIDKDAAVKNPAEPKEDGTYQPLLSVENGGVTVSFADNGNSNKPALWKTGEFRLYADETFTFTAGDQKIEKIEIEVNTGSFNYGGPSVNVGTLDSDGKSKPSTLTWTAPEGGAAEVTFTVPSKCTVTGSETKAAQFRWNSAKVYLAETGGSAAFPFVITEAASYLDPKPGVVSELGRVQISLTGEYTRTGDATLTINGQPAELYGQLVDPFDGETFVSFTLVDINYSDGYTEPGEYVISIPEGYLTNNETGAKSMAETLVYTIGGGSQGGLVDVDATFTPEDPACFNIWTVQLNGIGYSLVCEPGESVKITNPNNETATCMYPTEIGDNLFRLSFGTSDARKQMLSVPGEYTIVIPAKMFAIDDRSIEDYEPGNSAEIVFTTTLGGGVTPSPKTFKITTDGKNFDPAPNTETDPLEYIGRIQFELSGDYTRSGDVTYTVNGQPGSPVLAQVIDPWEGTTFVDIRLVDLNEIDGLTASGTYVFNFPAGYLTNTETGATSEAETITYYVGDGSQNPPTPPTPGTFKISNIAREFDPVPDEMYNELSRVQFALGGDYERNGDVTYTVNGLPGAPVYAQTVDIFMGTTYVDILLADVNNGETLSDPGMYVVTFPEGYFVNKETGDKSLAESFTYYVVRGSGPNPGDDPTITWTPASNTCFNVWDIKINGVSSDDIGEPGLPITIKNPQGTVFNCTYPSYKHINDYQMADHEYTINFGDNPTTVAGLSISGEYVITIPAGMFIFNDPNADTSLPGNSPEYIYTATLTGGSEPTPPAPEIKWTVTPSPDSEITSLQQFVIDFTGYMVSFKLNSFEAHLLVPGETTPVELDGGFGAEGAVLSAAQEYTAEGEYELWLKEGSYVLLDADGNSTPSPAVSVKYVIGGQTPVDPSEIKFETTPAEGSTVSDVSKIIITFPGATEVLNVNQLMLVASNGELSYKLYDNFEGEGTNSIVYAVEDGKSITEDGTWTVTFSPKAISVDGVAFQGTKLTFIVKHGAVEGIEADADNFTVFSLQGVCLLRNADKEALDTLAPGLYIINGKKVMIRK